MEQEIEYKGYKIKIIADEDPQNPRTDWDPAGTMVCWHSRYNLGDCERWKGSDGKWKSKQLSSNYPDGPKQLLYELAGVDSDSLEEDMKFDELYSLIEEKGTIIKTLYLYDHSGLTISTGSFSCRWDSGPVGYIYMTKETQEKEGWTPEQADKYLEGEVKTYDDYLTGNVYGYQIENPDGDETDSCWGYFGDPEEKGGCIDEAKSAIDYLVKKDQEEYEKQPKKKAAEFYTL